MGRFSLAPSGFRGRLLLILLAISTLPLLAIAAAFLYILNANVEAETFGKLAFVRDAKRGEIEQYLAYSERQAQSLAKSNAVRYAIGDFYGFSYAFRQIDPSPERATAILQKSFGVDDPKADHMLPVDNGALLRVALEYANSHSQFHDDFAGFVRTSEFDNVYLINTEGRVVYSVIKDHYLGADLSLGLSGTPIGLIAAAAAGAPMGAPTLVSDFVRDPISGAYGALLAARVEFYHKFRGVVVFHLPATGIDRTVQAQNGATGSLYLLSAQDEIISAPPGTSAMTAAPSSAAFRAMTNSRTTIAAHGLSGEPALAAWSQIDFARTAWLLVAEVPTAIAFANTDALRRIVIGIAGGSLPILVLIVLVLSRNVTAPLLKLSDAAEAIAAGDLDRPMPSLEHPREVRRLTASFRRMRDAVKDQLDLIGQKNTELQRQVEVIEEKNTALEEADRLKDAFLANTSHELRTPLNGIIGISETLSAGAAGDLSSAQRSQLQLVALSARRLSRLVDDLLDIYRIRQGRMRLDIHPVHVASSVHNVLQMSEPLLRGEPVTLNVDIPDAIGFVLADPVRFEQILYNLIGNAIKYTDQGSISIAAEIGPDGQVAIHVADTGSGISPENLERIFQPLEQADGVDGVRRSAGTGLGLTIARELATLLDGGLTAASTVGVGSNFTLTLPAATITTDETRMLADETTVRGLNQSIDMLRRVDGLSDYPVDRDAPLILVVDDEPINLQVLKNVLKPFGYSVHSAESGREALEMVEQVRPDLMVLDVMMPGMSGLEVAKRLRERYTLLDLPIIMVTARSRTRDVVAGFEHGANDYVVKPFVKEELLARITTLLAANKSHGRAVENTELRREIDRRVQVEDALRLSQHRMAQLLDTLEAGLVCVNDIGRIIYANQAALRSVTPPIVLGHTALSDIVPQSALEQMIRIVEGDGQGEFPNVAIGGGSAKWLLHAFELEPEAGAGFAVVMTRDNGLSSQSLVRSVQGVMDSVGTTLTVQEPPDALAIEGVLSQPRNAAGKDFYRHAIVELTVMCLAVWRKATGASKIDFAEQSGIWRVNLDRSSLQARTLDKYLLIETLPLNPRWRDVVQSAEFVLAATEKHAATDPSLVADRAELRQKLTMLRDFVRDTILFRRGARPSLDEAPEDVSPG